MKKIAIVLSFLVSMSGFAKFEAVDNAEVSLTIGSGIIAAGEIVSSVSVSFEGKMAKELFEALGTTTGATEFSKQGATFRYSENKAVGCAKSKDPQGKDFIQCGVASVL